jgi:uncharacterized protein (UPF0332 family)
MIKQFDYYVKNNLVKKTTINFDVVNALLKRAELRLKLNSKKQFTDEESSIVFEQIYESVREATQALLQKQGFKPFSHEALVAFMIKNKFEPSIVNTFNKYRILRNKSVYEAVEISENKCQEAIEFAKKFIPKIKERLK